MNSSFNLQKIFFSTKALRTLRSTKIAFCRFYKNYIKNLSETLCSECLSGKNKKLSETLCTECLSGKNKKLSETLCSQCLSGEKNKICT